MKGPILSACIALSALLVAAGSLSEGRPSEGTRPGVDALGARVLTAQDFHQVTPWGFGDRQNSWAWSMQWWKDHLYVGTVRAMLCIHHRMINIGFPFIPYPMEDPDLECAEDPNDLPLQAEIWRWDPREDLWERIFQSPADIPIPGTDKFVARDLGFRAFQVFREPDGTEALYASGVSSRPIHHEEPRPPPARLLRTVDGEHFEPVPQDPGTFLGDLGNASFRGMAPFKGRLYVLAGTFTGPGIVLESDDPARGNDSFRKVSPPGMRVMELHPYNGYLYFGLRETEGRGYSLVKTDAEGDLPYTFTTVIPPGGGISTAPNTDLLSMVEFKGYLYCGGNGIGNDLGSPDIGPEPGDRSCSGCPPEEEFRYIRAAEIVRVHPDDTWDLIVGRPRYTADGFKVPLSGFSSGFNYPFNNHMWRMVVHNGVLYVGTFDSSTVLKESPLRPLLEPFMGFDLYASTDGIHFRSVTRKGLGYPLQFGCRTLASTPYGLFLGTATYYYGAIIFQATP